MIRTPVLLAALLAAWVVLPAAAADPVIAGVTVDHDPVAVGVRLTVTATVSDADGDALLHRWSFGDGTTTAWSSSPTAFHVHTAPGRLPLTLQVKDGPGADAALATATRLMRVHRPLTPRAATAASSIVHDGDDALWVADADNDAVASLTASTLAPRFVRTVGREPRGLARAGDGSIWVACRRDTCIDVLAAADGERVARIALPYGSAPVAICAAPDGATLYAALAGRRSLLRLDAATRTPTDELPLGAAPRGLAISGDGDTLLATRLISPEDGGVVWRVDPRAMALRSTIRLAIDTTTVDDGHAARGLPNYLMHVAIAPDGRRAWVAAKQDNMLRGVLRDGQPLTFETSVRSLLCLLDPAGSEVVAERLDIDDQELPSAICFSPIGDLVFVAYHGNHEVRVFDGVSGAPLTGATGVGSSPLGLCLDPSARRLYVHASLSRTVEAYDVAALVDATGSTMTHAGTAAIGAVERLAPAVLRGKRLFNGAEDERMSRDGYLSCATCHLDGDHDGRTWDFTDRGEGLRNTTSLLGRRGTGHGRVHWSANFDEIHDFEHDIRGAFAGSGFMSEEEFATGTRDRPLGDAKAGASAELDDLAAYVASLDRIPDSPFRQADGAATPAGVRGRAVFARLGCQSCHAGDDFTDSAAGLLHDVGTITPASGKRLGGPLPGIDTPTLRGAWDTAPYFHDGSAATLANVLARGDEDSAHGVARRLSPDERDDLIAFLRELDDGEPAVPAGTRRVTLRVLGVDGDPETVSAALHPPHASPSIGMQASFEALSSALSYRIELAALPTAIARGRSF